MTDEEPKFIEENQVVGQAQASRKRARPVWLTAPLIVATVVALLVGGGVGAAIGISSQQGQIQSLSASLSTEQTNNGDLSSKNSSLTAAVNQANADQAARAKKDTDLTTREAAVTARENAVKAAETVLADSQFTDGIHVVGTTVQPGVYSIKSSTDCYYVWKSGTDSNATIIDNNIVNGPATVTLKQGDVFETSRCGTWTKQG